jgi:hypothetical protein
MLEFLHLYCLYTLFVCTRKGFSFNWYVINIRCPFLLWFFSFWSKCTKGWTILKRNLVGWNFAEKFNKNEFHKFSVIGQINYFSDRMPTKSM